MESIHLSSAGATGLAFATRERGITPAERERALRYLSDTRAVLTHTVDGLSDDQWRFKPAVDVWSVAEGLEHLAILEELFVTALGPQIAQAPAGEPGVDAQQVDAMILARVPDRSTRFQVPPPLQPMGRPTLEESLRNFLENREKTLRFLANTDDLRDHVVPHPALGPLDGYQWVIAVAAHTERHTKQILEVKADPEFPSYELR